jgi:outer membrane protein assembly factor BamD|tara:strand:- start:6463 stop:7272 length:810 start_codon:yes stop_codon:yes gene_type:complete
MKKIFISIILISSFLSCSNYQKILKSDDINFKYNEAVKYYKDADFNRALPIFTELLPLFRGTAKAEELAYYYAYTHYSIGDYLMASYLFNKYIINFPRSLHAEESKFMIAFCHYQEAPEFSLDATNTIKAISKFQDFIDKYPQSDSIKTCNNLMDQLRLNLSNKAFANAKQYYTTENYRAAITALDNVLINYPSIKNREEIYYIILESSYFLAINSIQSKKENRLFKTIDSYNQFKDNYPLSIYNTSAKKIHTNTLKTIEELKLNKNEI